MVQSWATSGDIDHETKVFNQALPVGINFTLNIYRAMKPRYLLYKSGATNEIPAHATAYPHRDVEFIMNVHIRWRDAKSDEKRIQSARQFYQDTLPHATGGAYINFVSEGDDSVDGIYGKNARRLNEIKSKYDPKSQLKGTMALTGR